MLDDELYSSVRTLAAVRGQSVSFVVEEALGMLMTGASGPQPHRSMLAGSEEGGWPATADSSRESHADDYVEEIKLGVRRFAQDQGLSFDQAVAELFPSVHAKHAKVDAELEEALSKIAEIRARRADEVATVCTPNPLAGMLIGMLKDEPELVEAIREAGRERRQRQYGPK